MAKKERFPVQITSEGLIRQRSALEYMLTRQPKNPYALRNKIKSLNKKIDFIQREEFLGR